MSPNKNFNISMFLILKSEAFLQDVETFQNKSIYFLYNFRSLNYCIYNFDRPVKLASTTRFEKATSVKIDILKLQCP